MFAYPEALSHAERALTLWEHVADAAELTGLSHAAMLRFTATLADNCGNSERALAFARAALDAVDEDTDPIEAALVHERIGRYMYYENYAPDDLLEHNRTAVRLVPEVPPSIERAECSRRSASSSWSRAGIPKRSRRVRCASRSRARWAPV